MSDPAAARSAAPAPEAVAAFCEYLRLFELDQTVEFETFCGERPELIDGLRRLRDEYERVSAILARLAPAGSFSDRLRARYGDAVDPGISLSGDAPPDDAERTPQTRDVLARLSAQGPTTRRYEPRGEIARGGMGVILKVWDSELRRTLAMKVVLGRKRGSAASESSAAVDERRLSRFLEEAQITGQLDHPGIVPVHDIGIDSKGRVYFTMQLVDGRDLREVFELARLQREGWTKSRIVGVFMRVCEAMAYAHSKGVVHRDLKPANVMVGRFGEAFVMDWGLAKVTGREDRHDLRLAPGRPSGGSRVVTDRSAESDEADSPLKTMDGDVVGTPAYMAPEQAQGRLSEVGPRSDVYSIGAMLYHLISGHMPYEPLGEKVPTTTILEAVRNGSPWPLRRADSGFDRELVAICEKAMAREPEQRYGDMLELAEELRSYVEGRVVRAYETGVLYEFQKWVVRNKGVAAALGALAVLTLAAVGIFILQQQINLDKLASANVATLAAEKDASDRAEELSRAAGQLAHAVEQATAEARRAKESAEQFEGQKNIATLQRLLARQQTYRAQIVAAAYSLRLNEIDIAKESLAAAHEDLRRWEWEHLELSMDTSVGTVLSLDKGITSLDTDRSGRRLITNSLDMTARVVDLESGASLARINTSSGLLSGLDVVKAGRVRAAMSPNGLFAAAAAADRFVHFLNVEKQEVVISRPHSGAVTGLDFSSDGLRLAACSSETTRVWDTYRMELLADLDGHQGPISAAALSPDGKRVATGGVDGGVRVWDVATGSELMLVPGVPGRPVTALDWAPRGPPREAGGELVAIAYGDGSLATWDVDEKDLVAVMHGHRGAVEAVLFAADGETLYSGGEDVTVRAWDVKSGAQRRVLRGHDSAVTALARSGELLLSASLDRTVKSWDPGWDSARTVIELPGAPIAIGFDAAGERVLTCPQSGEPSVWNADSATLEATLALEPAGDDPARPARRNEAMDVSADGRVCAVAGADRRVLVTDWSAGTPARELAWRPARVRRLALSADGAVLAVLTYDRVVHLYDWRAGEELASLARHPREVLDLAFAPDARSLATVGRDRSLRLWDARDGELRGLWPDAHSDPINAVAFSPDGRLIATASSDASLKLWEPGAREPVLTLRGHAAEVTAVAFDARGERLVSGSADRTLQVWDVETGSPLLALAGHGGRVQSVAFSPDGARIVSGAPGFERERFELCVWDTRAARPRYLARQRARELERRAGLEVARRFEQLGWPERVLAALAGDRELEPGLRVAALLRARQCADDPAFLRDRCLDVLLEPGASGADCEAALRSAVRASSLDEGDRSVLAVLGAAQVRSGRYEEGRATLERSRGEDGEDPLARARRALFLALAQARLGQADLARRQLDEVNGALANLHLAGEDELEPLMHLEPLARTLARELEAGTSDGR